MKKQIKKFAFIFIALLFLQITLAQTPQSFKYQSVVRDANGNAMQNQAIDFKISILQTTSTGTTVYSETFSTTTNDFGLVNLEIGTGTVISGTFSSIDWGVDKYYLQVELDPDGNGYQLMGVSQLLSVPYALNAAKANLNGDVTGNSDSNTVEKIRGMEVSTNIPGDGQVLKWDNATSKWIPADDNTVSGSGVDGVVTSIGVSGTGSKTITITRSNSLSDLTAVFTDEINDADADPNNEIQVISISNDTIYLTNGGYVKLPAGFSGDYNDLSNKPTIPTQTSDLINDSGFITSPDDADHDPNNEIQAISFSGDTLYLSNGNSVYLGNYSNIWQQNGNDIYYNNGYVGVGLTDPHGKLIVKGDASIPADSAIFEVRNKDGQVVFAVYQEGVRIYVDDTGSKAISSKGGFAVGGYNATKSLTNEYLRVTPDSVRIYIEEGTGSKSISTKGGFAVGGYNATKIIPTDYFNISASDSAGTINPSEARVMWYPLKEAFLSGRVLIESADSIGLNSFATGFECKSIGDYSQSFGYKSRAIGYNSTAIGTKVNALGVNSMAFGDSSIAKGYASYAFGTCGFDTLTGLPTTFRTEANGDYSLAFGFGTKTDSIGGIAFGSNSAALGSFSFATGLYDTTYAPYSVALGVGSSTKGSHAVAIGLHNVASGGGSYSIGAENTASGLGAFAFGYKSESSGHGSYAIGAADTSSGPGAVAIGVYANSSGAGSFAIGDSIFATGDAAFAIGYKSISSSYGSYAIGNNDTSIAIASFAIGTNADATGNFSFAIGTNALSSNTNSMALGNSTVASGNTSTAMGYSTTASGSYSTSFGRETVASGYYSTAFGRSTVADGISSTVFGQNMTVNGDYSFGINLNTTAYTITDNNVMAIMGGKVGIGTISPASFTAVQVNTDITYGYAAYFFNDGNSTDRRGIRIQAGIDDATGDNYMIRCFDGNGTYEGALIIDDGVLEIVQNSDSTLKNNIFNTKVSANSILNKIRVVDYSYKECKNARETGFVAQELLEVFPEMVIKDPDTKKYGIKPLKLIPILTKANQEQQEIIDDLLKRIEKLEKLVNENK